VSTRRGLTVACVQDAEAFVALRGEWAELLHASGRSNPFLTWEWLHPWWVHFGNAHGLRLLVVRDGGELMAVAPLWLISAPLYWFSRLEFLGTGEAGSDYLDVIVRRGREDEAVGALAEFLTARQLTLRLTHLPPASIAAQLAKRLSSAGWMSSFADDGVCPVVDLSGHTFESYLATLGASHRANIRRRLRALDRKFEVRFDRVTRHQERQSALAALAEFHSRRYTDRGGSTAFTSPAARAFHEDATRLALDCGWLRMYQLTLNGALAAVMYGFSDSGRFFFYQHGYDEHYAAQSVGLALMALTIRAAISEGASEFDMLWGTESYKSLWARRTHVLRRVDLYPVHLGGSVQRHAAEARRGAAGLARRVLSLRTAGATRAR
jgi:CelD/BcsL family acetyltransferase involved in cellulose biosynthesis